MSGPSGDSARVTVFVEAPRERAFRVFTEEVDHWWRHGKKYRIAGRHPGRIWFECRLGGKMFEFVERGAGRTHQVGEIVQWDPPAAFAFEWRTSNFRPHEKTLVEVSFSEVLDGTMVRVVHSGWLSLRPDHPARHGLSGAAHSGQVGMWWGGLMTSLQRTLLLQGQRVGQQDGALTAPAPSAEPGQDPPAR